ncbi:M2 family metallopeptidase [Permianibacter sp. IMCC34836]|uniref:M2 family metallopeptidase n=1 Tax=Permianibacter fluminis TaxID=2738515 RepID=UPI0015525A8B|nr:M2 family metallopeptidase [Permianibacter fluminis]NQD37618.1 M2 family metallopeptidase [Permianibacter fluminis]
MTAHTTALTRKTHTFWRPALLVTSIALGLAGCSQPESPQQSVQANGTTVADAEKFVATAEAELLRLNLEAQRAAWVSETFITPDTEALVAKANEVATAKSVEFANQSKQFIGMELPPELNRKLEKIRLALVLPAPSDAAKTEELAKISSSLNAQYGSGKYCKNGSDGKQVCLSLGELEDIIANKNSKPAERLEAWTGWHSISPAMRPEYTRMVEIANEGAKELGYVDTGAMWRAKYDMSSDDFAKELDRLWGQVQPLYNALHCHVRAKLNERFGDDVVSKTGPIPAHMLGNMWAQTWDNVYDFVAPPTTGSSYNLDDLVVKAYGKATDLKASDVDNVNNANIFNLKQSPEGKMVQAGEGFFSSLGFAPLPDSFWSNSQFLKPRDRDVVCHASAWDLDNQDDVRIKMCIKMNGEDFVTIHHELGHNYYQRAYKNQPFLFMDSANDGFHEAIGDTIALGITPAYLKQIGMIDKEPDASQDVNILMRKALEKVAFLPFGLMVDQWRWRVFSGEIPADKYNEGWWQLREKYQGVKAPVARSEKDFDAGAKYHVPGGVPYSRYFLADVLQFQFYREMCKMAGHQGPLHRCTFYGNKEVGERLNKMLEMGASKPWQDALEAMTGQREMDASAIQEYFAPLKAWLDEQNVGRTCGW